VISVGKVPAGSPKLTDDGKHIIDRDKVVACCVAPAADIDKGFNFNSKKGVGCDANAHKGNSIEADVCEIYACSACA
jgi:hypothetical protein